MALPGTGRAFPNVGGAAGGDTANLLSPLSGQGNTFSDVNSALQGAGLTPQTMQSPAARLAATGSAAFPGNLGQTINGALSSNRNNVGLINRLRSGTALGSPSPFDFGNAFSTMPADAQKQFQNHFGVLDKLPMNQQLGWWANLIGPQGWPSIMNALGQGSGGLAERLRDAATGGKPRSDQTG